MDHKHLGSGKHSLFSTSYSIILHSRVLLVEKSRLKFCQLTPTIRK
uniref:Uncharacterized protein n=1 Tax=Anguilla anguilla TaxID=7936 RepID=A0A0E9W9N8_ANGAN